MGARRERLSRLVGRIGDGELISGVVGSKTDHFGVPYAITEEFVAVYRMHPLIPDDYVFRAAADHRLLLERDLEGVAQRKALDVLGLVPMADLFYSFGIAARGDHAPQLPAGVATVPAPRRRVAGPGRD